MKKYLFFLLVIVTATLTANYAYVKQSVNNPSKGNTHENVDTEIPEVLGSPSSYKELTLTQVVFNETRFTIASSQVENIDNLTLKSNLSIKLSSSVLFDQLGCLVLVSGGFYTKENTPVGLFIENGEKLSNFKNSALFDGVFSLNYYYTPRITRDVPYDDLKYAVQSGPILIENSIVQDLSIKNDNPNRRVVAATTGDNELVFMIIYDDISRLFGPMLADLPQVLDVWQKETGITLADAINLDGGSASAFISEDFKLTESSPIGSYFCY